MKAGLHTVGVTFLATNDVPDTDLERAVPAHDEHAAARSPDFSSSRTSGRCAIEGPLNATGASDTPSRRKIFVCRPASAASEEDACARTIVSTLVDAGLPPSGDAGRRRQSLMEFYRDRARRGRQLRRRHRSGAAARARRSGVRLPRRDASRPNVAAGTDLSHQRSGAGVAAVVLPVEQHSGRRADRPRRAGQAHGSGGARDSRCGGCWPIRSPRRWSRISPASG